MTILNEDNKIVLNYSANINEWIRDQKQVSRNLICKVISLPENINLELAATLCSIFELHAISINGLSRCLRMSDDGGIHTLHDECQGTINFQIPERYGYPIFNALKVFVTEHFVGKSVQDNSKFELLFIEPDATFTLVANAWLLRDTRFCGQFMKIEGMRNISLPQQPVIYNLSIVGKYEQNRDVLMSCAQEQLDTINAKNKYSTT